MSGNIRTIDTIILIPSGPCINALSGIGVFGFLGFRDGKKIESASCQVLVSYTSTKQVPG